MARNALIPALQPFQLPTGPDAGNFLNPLMAGIQRADRLSQQAVENNQNQERLGLAKNADARASSEAADAKRERMFKTFGAMNLAVINEPDEAKARQMFQTIRRVTPDFDKEVGSQGLDLNDYRSVSRVLAARAGVLPDPLERERGALQNQVLRRQLAQPVDDGSKIVEVNGQIVRVPRKGLAEEVFTAKPKPAAPMVKEVNGKLVAVSPDGTKATEIYGGSEGELATKISGTLNELATIPQRYDSFQDAVGSFQGGDIPVVSQAARIGGSIASAFSKTSPSEVRRSIDGTSETLAATIKGLIRKPGEGSWTDADQKRLDYIVGDLKKANNVAEYNRGLEEVRRRVEASFNIKLPPLNISDPGKLQGRAPAAQMPRIQSDQDYQALPTGTQYMAPDGSVRTKR